MTVDQPRPFKRFWLTWRRELIRGAVLFTLVLVAGFGVLALVRNIKARVPAALGNLGSFGDFNWGDGDAGALFGGDRQVGDPWTYTLRLTPSQHVWIRNTNGPINVVPGSGDSLVVHVEKSWRSSAPGIVQLVPVVTERGVTICAMWEARERHCADGGDYRLNGVRKNDVAVRFTVELPHATPVDASTVNGELQIDGVSAPVDATTVNGRIGVTTSTGPVNATTVNGSIDAMMQSLTSGDVHLTTVNGSVTAGLPKQLNADIDAETVNGRVETELPIRIEGKLSPHHLRGTIGNGGPTLKFVTVNGSITLHEASSPPPPHPLAPVAPHVRAHERTPPPARP